MEDKTLFNVKAVKLENLVFIMSGLMIFANVLCLILLFEK